MPKSAAAMPGKIGDCLYSLPTLRKLHRDTGEIFDFYTSQYCAPLKALFEYQEFINTFIVAQDYILDNFGCGAQPWYVPIPDHYNRILQFGFKRTPDRVLHEFIWFEQFQTVPYLSVEYTCPETDPIAPVYYCLATRGITGYLETFQRVVELSPVPVAIIGGVGDYQGFGIDCTGRDMLDTCSLLKNSVGFIGLMSSQLVLANGFPIPRVVPHDNKSWDMRHAVQSHLNHYLINPSAEAILQALCS